MKEVNVLFVMEDTGCCKQIFKELNGNSYYCRVEGLGWYTTNKPDFEADCPLNANVNICDKEGNILTSDKNYPFMEEFVKEKCKDIIDNYKDYYEWKKYILEDKEKHNNNDYDDNWLFFETKEVSRKVEFTLNYLEKEIKVVRRVYEHNISKKRWTDFMAKLGESNIKILGYDY